MFKEIKNAPFSWLAIASLALLNLLIMPDVSFCLDKLRIEASLWEYTSLCDFHDSTNWPTKVIYKKDTSITSIGCKDLEEKYGHPPAILVKLKNKRVSEMEIPLKGMDSITIATKKGSIAPLAIRGRQPSSFGGGFINSFDTEFVGEKVLVLKGNQVVDIIFFVSDASTGDTVIIKGVGTAKLRYSP